MWVWQEEVVGGRWIYTMSMCAGSFLEEMVKTAIVMGQGSFVLQDSQRDWRRAILSNTQSMQDHCQAYVTWSAWCTSIDIHYS